MIFLLFLKFSVFFCCFLWFFDFFIRIFEFFYTLWLLLYFRFEGTVTNMYTVSVDGGEIIAMQAEFGQAVELLSTFDG